MSSKLKICIAVAVTFILTASAGFYFTGLQSGGRLYRLEAVTSIIDSRYIGEFDREAAEDAAISAYVAAIGDPYAAYYNKSSSESFQNTVKGNYVGIGIEVYDNLAGDIVVLAAYNGSPAKRAGIKSGDVITAVDGVSFSAEKMADAVLLMKGANIENPVGTELTLTVRRGDENLDIAVTREEIDLYRIESSVVGDSILYLRYSGFSAESADNLGKLLSGAEDTYKGVILDLRENPGGDLDAAVDVCDMFLDDGLIMYTENKSGDRTEMRAKEGACKLPLAVLVNEGSASASEVVAGCIQARERGKIIGEKTYGKGVSQMIFKLGLEDNSEMVKITGYKNYRPDGIWLDEAVTPDIKVESEIEIDEYGNVTFGEPDEALMKAIEEISGR
ncbi:MAG: S41 family peptidase [Oscillospiraceae bacterium]|nr:S41 family peptidase [Oscillospiraceae bacterium]